MISIVLILFSFFCGSLPFSLWLGKLFFTIDIREVGDGNPGATNLIVGGNYAVGLLALFLDISKAAFPVGLAYNNLDIRGFPMFLIAIAPLLGNIFSPFLNFKGGKGIAVALGIWIGLTTWKASIPGALAAGFGYLLITPSVWSVMLGLGVILATLIIWLPGPLLLSVWIFETILLLWTHRSDLYQPPKLRSWLSKLFRSKKQSPDG